MHNTRRAKWLAVPIAGALVLAACGSDDDSGSDSTEAAGTEVAGTDAPDSTDEMAEGEGEGVSLAGVCPDTVVIQTDWNPEAEHGWLYEMIGENPEISAGSGSVTGPLVTSGGAETGVQIEIRSGGPLIGFQTVTSQMDYFTQTGILAESQVDGSYDGTPAGFLADQGESAQQGFGSAEPYVYQNEVADWEGKPVAYDYINDAGWENYGESIAVRADALEENSACLELLVPIIQQSSVDYVTDPAETNALIIEAVNAFDNGWVYNEDVAAYAVDTMKADGLLGNGPDGTIGNFDLDRVTGLIALAIPVYESLGQTPKEGLTAEDVVTNQFIDE
ncbi:MAG: ABC transporter substrate-binding protein, partial [Actinobacteria bacterium]|nr:ABC transporter substrate-binding protein [Actinomycetota bacterium]